MKRVHFLQNMSLVLFGVSTLGFANKSMKSKHHLLKTKTKKTIQLSLAQWSLNKSIRNGTLDPYDFAKISSGFGFSGLEYVTQLYKDIYNAKDKNKAIENFVTKSLAESQKYDLDNVLIMIDGEGRLSNEDETKRLLAVENHRVWIDAAAKLGCNAIRVNLYGTINQQLWKELSVKSLMSLSEHASKSNINIVVENHGGLSSNAGLLMEVINAVNLPNCGTLPDFGNFCIAKEEGACVNEYDKYKGVQEMMPRALAVSAKSYDFDLQGNETKIDYERMLNVVLEAGYAGYIGVEYEGKRMPVEDGILHTKRLIEKYILSSTNESKN